MTDRRPLGTGPARDDNPELSPDTTPRPGLAAERLPTTEAGAAADPTALRPGRRRVLGTGPGTAGL
ncbi:MULTISPECIES: hypothetical protein [unclassified Streptomyces]|uniref:hypothetical protein n=1 Tax=unclassified Streptomyces TaxID=2593676 RepID=UPI0038126E77